MKRIIKNKKGFTLVEVLVAVLLISIAAAALVASVSSAVNINRESKIKDAAFQENLKTVQTFEGSPVEGSIGFDGYNVNVEFFTSENPKGENLTFFRRKG